MYYTYYTYYYYCMQLVHAAMSHCPHWDCLSVVSARANTKVVKKKNVVLEKKIGGLVLQKNELVDMTRAYQRREDNIVKVVHSELVASHTTETNKLQATIHNMKTTHKLQNTALYNYTEQEQQKAATRAQSLEQALTITSKAITAQQKEWQRSKKKSEQEALKNTRINTKARNAKLAAAKKDNKAHLAQLKKVTKHSLHSAVRSLQRYKNFIKRSLQSVMRSLHNALRSLHNATCTLQTTKPHSQCCSYSYNSMPLKPRQRWLCTPWKLA